MDREEGYEGNQMASELDAAWALADLAQMALRESGEKESGRRSSRKRVENFSPGPSKPSRSEGSLVACHQEEKHDGEEEIQREAKVQGKWKLPSSHDSFSGSRANQNLTEAEKEARRMRRVLANRESARQTIRRRQALHQELTKKVADLSLDNQNIKMEKEMIMKEYQSLKNTNKQLKEQMTKASKCESKPTREAETSTSSSAKLPLVVCIRRPFQPYPWPSWPAIPLDIRPFIEQGIRPKDSIWTPHHYLSPCAWFYPSLQPCTDATRDKDVKKPRQHFRTEACVPSSMEASITKDKNADRSTSATPIGCHVESHTLRAYSKGMILTPSSLGTINLHSDAKTEAMVDDVDGSTAERPRETSFNSHERSNDVAVAAAAARKRRKKLTKLKRLHGRQVKQHG